MAAGTASTGTGAIIVSVYTAADSWLTSSDSAGADSNGVAIWVDTSGAFGLSISISSSNCWAVTISFASTVWRWLVLPLSHTSTSTIEVGSSDACSFPFVQIGSSDDVFFNYH